MEPIDRESILMRLTISVNSGLMERFCLNEEGRREIKEGLGLHMHACAQMHAHPHPTLVPTSIHICTKHRCEDREKRMKISKISYGDKGPWKAVLAEARGGWMLVKGMS